MKAGTTSLHRVLAERNDVRLVSEKEGASLLPPIAGEVRGRWRGGDCRVAAEVSTRYTQQPLEKVDAAAAVAVLGDGARVAAMLRDPWDRALSHYRHWVDIGFEQRPLADAVGDPDPDNPYVAFSDYWRQLRPWFEAVGPDRLRVWWLEDYGTTPLTVERDLAQFLGLPPPDKPTAAWENSAEARPALRGGIGRIVRSDAYRRVVRPLLPAGLRRTVAQRLSHDERATVPPEAVGVEATFRLRVNAGLEELAAHVAGGARTP
jgi:hypothetical protein